MSEDAKLTRSDFYCFRTREITAAEAVEMFGDGDPRPKPSWFEWLRASLQSQRKE